MIENAEIVEGTDGEAVEPGCVVELRYEGDDDTDLYFFGSVEERGVEHDIISPGSPLGEALVGRKPGDKVDFTVAHRRQPHRRARQHPVTRRRRPSRTARRSAGRRRCLPGGPLELPGRGTTFVRHHPAPAGRADGAAPARHPGDGRRQLVHRPTRRWPSATAWWPSTTAATVAGIRADRAVRLADCADDAVAALDVLGIERAIAVGYSMGGPIAQLVWHRHRDRTAGLVLCATAHRFRGVEPVRDLGPALLQRLRAGRGAGEAQPARPRCAGVAHRPSSPSPTAGA